jgi:hypothetical protein
LSQKEGNPHHPRVGARRLVPDGYSVSVIAERQ